MYQVTALYQDAEIAFAESESYEDAARECADSVPAIYPESEVVLTCSRGVLTVRTPLDVWRMFA